MFNLKFKHVLFFLTSQSIIFFGIYASQQEIVWKGNWALRCNFTSNDFKVERWTREICVDKCINTYGCSHYVWIDKDNGTCFLKRGPVTKSNVSFSNDHSSICGIIDTFPIINDIKTTKYAYINDEGACQLPIAEYAVTNPVALGTREVLDYLKFRPSMCGQVLEIDCGSGKLDIIVINSMYGGGLDLYDSTWQKAVFKKDLIEPDVTRCSVVLTKKNAFKTDKYLCYHASDMTDNIYYRSVGLFNTKGKIIVGAEFRGRNATAYEKGYFSFYNYGTDDDYVTFHFEFGGSYSVLLKDCPKNLHYQKWS